jgi:aminomethyltransferase
VDVFTTMEQEYFAIRNATTLYDLTPMVKYRIVGPDALAYLNRLVSRDLSKLKPDRVAYCVWCNDAGHLVDDGTVFRLGSDEYRLCTADRQIDWLLDSAIGFDVTVEEITEQIAALSVQGPTSCAVLKDAGLLGLELLKPFDIGHFTLAGYPVVASRTGFTGDLGYELWMDPESAEPIWDALMEAGRSRGIRAIGSQALNIARLEAGFLSPHVDFVSAEHTIRTGRDRSPLELGLGVAGGLQQGAFQRPPCVAGGAATRSAPATRRTGHRRQQTGAQCAALHRCQRYREIGNISSAAWSPTCKRNIALAMVDAPHFQIGSIVWAEIYLNRELVWERRMSRAEVVERPFFAPSRRRTTPPGEF